MDGGVTDGEEPKEAHAETYSDIFDRLFPDYLMIGMSPEQYWDGEVGLLRAYRDAYVQRVENEERRKDIFAWTIGRYVKDAIQSTYLLVNGFVPKSTHAIPYPDQPYSLKEKARQEQEKKTRDREAKKKAEEEKTVQSMAYFQAAVAQYNRNFKKRKEQEEKAKTLREQRR